MSGIILPFDNVLPRVDARAFVAETAVVVGDVEIGAGASVWYGCVLRGDVNRIRVGRNVNLQDGTIVHVNHDRTGDGGEPTHIGDEVTVGHMALIHACTLEDGCFVGMRAVVMDRAVAERGAMVGAGALVTPGKVVRAGELWAGAPARRVRALGEAESEELRYLNRHYVELANAYRAARGPD